MITIHDYLTLMQALVTSEKNGTILPTLTVPDQFSRATMERLRRKEVTDASRNEIISAIAIPLYQQTMYPKPEEYTTICKKLVEKYPVLKDSCGNGYVSHSSKLL